MEGVPGTLYEGEKFVLQFKFTNKYPFDSPEVSRIAVWKFVIDKKMTCVLIKVISYVYNKFYQKVFVWRGIKHTDTT